MSKRLRALWLALALVASAAAPAARAELWGYVDEKGVAHFAAERLDERYELFFRSGESVDTAEGGGGSMPRAVAVPTAPARLLAYFEVAPGYKQVKHHLREASKRHGIELELLQALIATESGFDADAISPRGAVGLMQIIPATAQRYGLSGDAKAPVHKKLADPKTNIGIGVRYLSDLIKMFPGRLELALAAYNAGEGAVKRAGRKIPDYPETQNYVKTVMQLYTMLKPPAGIERANPKRVRTHWPVLPATGLASGTPPLESALAIIAARRNVPPESAAAPGAHVAFRDDAKIGRE